MSNSGKYIIIIMLLLACVGVLVASKHEQHEQQDLVRSLEEVARMNNETLGRIFGSIDTMMDNLNSMEVLAEHLAALRADSVARESLMAGAELYHSADTLARANDNVVLNMKEDMHLLSSVGFDVEPLQGVVVRLENENMQQRSAIRSLRDSLMRLSVIGAGQYDAEPALAVSTQESVTSGYKVNKGYYIIGGRAMLQREGIMKRRFLLFGEERVVESASLEKFTTMDLHTKRHLYIGRRGVKLLSDHPEGSFRLVFDARGGVCNELVIENPELFWSRTKVLVVAYRNNILQ